MDFAEEIFEISNNFQQRELFNLTSQIQRASDSIALNISEGAILQSNPEFRRFLGYSIRSVAEVVTCLYKAQRRKYITDEVFAEKYNFAYKLMNHIIAFRNKLD